MALARWPHAILDRPSCLHCDALTPSAYAIKTGLVLAQVSVLDKANEIAAIHDLLDALEPAGTAASSTIVAVAWHLSASLSLWTLLKSNGNETLRRTRCLGM